MAVAAAATFTPRLAAVRFATSLQRKTMKAILRSGLIALAILALTVPAIAGPFEDGRAAYERGD